MTALRSLHHALLLLLTLLATIQTLRAQPVSELPRAEYYVARELYRIGRTLEAADGFQTALNRARRLGEGRWVDSIPPLIMLGECYYQQGNLAQALEQYDAALMLALANSGWIDQVEVQSEQLAELEAHAKGIGWFTKSRPTQAVIVPAGLQLSVDPTAAQVTQQGGVIAPVNLVTQLDVTEVIRTLGIALMRRWEVLGPLAKHSPLAAPLEAMFARNPRQQVPWLNASWRVLQGASSLASPNRVDSRQLLREGTLIANQADYYLSSLALLILGKLDAREGNYPAAIINLQDASLLAAQFEQHATVAEAIDNLSACAAASGRLDMLDPLQRLATWANKKSGSVQVAALVGASELAIYGNDFSLADKLLRQAAVVLRGREITLPRAQAQLAFTSALLAFAQNRSTLGISNLESALKFARGTAATGAVVESIFQSQLTLDLLATQSLTAAEAEAVLVDTVAEPTRTDWELTPLKTLAELTTARDPAYLRLLELASTRGASVEEMLERMDRVQRQRLYQALPLGGRLMAWRQAMGVRPDQLSPASRNSVEGALQRQPELITMGQQIESLVAKLRAAPIPLDDRRTPADAKKAFAELESLSSNFENQLAFISLQRRNLERLAPPAANLQSIQTQLAERDLVLAMVVGGGQIFGLAITRDQAYQWQVDEPAKLDASLSALLMEMGLVRDNKPSQPSEVMAPTAAWRITAEKIASSLFPADVQTLLDSCQRVIMIPHDRLWYVPFELLPQDANAGNPPWIVGRAVTYVPTLGSFEVAFGKAPKVQETVGIVGNFFALDATQNTEAASSIAQSIPGSHVVMLNQKVTVPSATWLKLKSDQLWVANTLESSDNGWEVPVLPLGKPQQARIGMWLDTPRTSPPIVLLPGLKTSLSQGQLGHGNELFLPICAMLYSGTKTACLSRWPVGGGSTKIFLQRQLEELQSERPSEALRRSVLAQWPEQFLLADEPLLLPAGKDSPPLVAGSHPLLWCGYLSVGDYVP